MIISVKEASTIICENSWTVNKNSETMHVWIQINHLENNEVPNLHMYV